MAYQGGGVDHLTRIGPFGDLPGASRLARVQYMDPVCCDGAMTVGVRWEAIGVTGGLFPVLDANITLGGEGSKVSRVVLAACYRLPPGRRALGWTGCSCTRWWPPPPSDSFWPTWPAPWRAPVARPGDRRVIVVGAWAGTGP